MRVLRDEVLEQLGKKVVKFDLSFEIGYLSGARRINFNEKDDIKCELKYIKLKGKTLWCEGLPERSLNSNEVLTVDSDSDNDRMPPKKRRKTDEKTALDAKVHRIDTLANKLKETYGEKYTKVQYKLWAEALDVKKHDSEDVPPPGPIWGNVKVRKSAANDSVTEMASAFTHMAKTVASAFKSDNESTPITDRECAG